MPEENGDRDTRLDRIERALEMFVADHEQFRHDHKQLFTAQVLQKDAIEQLFKTTQEHTRQIEELRLHSREQGRDLDARIEKLVVAIGEFVRKSGPA